MAQYAFLLTFLSLIITIRKQVEGENKSKLKDVIRDCVYERKRAGKEFDG